MNLPVKTLLAAGILAAASAPAQSADILPLVDAHLHYSHDAWDDLPPKDAIAAIRRAGLKRPLCRAPATRAPRCSTRRHPT